ncbi:hypothetical protein DIPPA_18032 [Diplonema papillatum]|nr:hypothetical protein DIPPA_18032 [Diplonema papillatum]
MPKKRGIRASDVVTLPSPGTVMADCEAAGIAWTAQHQACLRRVGTVVEASKAQGTATVAVDGVRTAWPLKCLQPSDYLPPHLYDRNLLNQVKLRRGKSLKALREELSNRPAVVERFACNAKIERENAAQRTKMMWAADASSKVRHVENQSTYRSTYTNPMGLHVIPAYPPPKVEKIRERFSIAWREAPKQTVKCALPPLPPPTSAPVPASYLSLRSH